MATPPNHDAIEENLQTVVKEFGINPQTGKHADAGSIRYTKEFATLLISAFNYWMATQDDTNHSDDGFWDLGPSLAIDKLKKGQLALRFCEQLFNELYNSNILSISNQLNHNKSIDIDFVDSFFNNKEEHLAIDAAFVFSQLSLLLENVQQLVKVAKEGKWKSLKDGLSGTNEFHLAVACLRFLKVSNRQITYTNLLKFVSKVVDQLTTQTTPTEHACRLAFEWWRVTQASEGDQSSDRPMDPDEIWWRTQFPAPLPANRPPRPRPSKKRTPK